MSWLPALAAGLDQKDYFQVLITLDGGRISIAALAVGLARLVVDLGEPSLSIAGLVIAGFAIGGLFYTLTVSRFLPRLGVKGMMISGATLVGLQLAAVGFGPRTATFASARRSRTRWSRSARRASSRWRKRATSWITRGMSCRGTNCPENSSENPM